MSEVRVSVAMCTYNGERFIEKQIKSILEQSKAVDEIIICDDGSKDQTLAIAEKLLAESTVAYRIERNEEALGVVRNFQKAYQLCSGDLIFSCDQDDIWRSDKVAVMVDYFEKYPRVSLIASNAVLIDEHDQAMNLTLREGLLFDAEKEEFHLFPQLLKRYCITGATMAMRKRFFEDCFHVSDLWLHDGLLAMMAGAADSLLYLDEKLTYYRLHGNNVCGIGDTTLLRDGTPAQLKQAFSCNTKKTILHSPFYYQDHAYEHYQRYYEVYEFLKKHESKDENLKRLTECLDFWRYRNQLPSLSWREFLKKRKQMKQNRAYENYMDDPCFYRGDLYFWFIYHIFSRYNHHHDIKSC